MGRGLPNEKRAAGDDAPAARLGWGGKILPLCLLALAKIVLQVVDDSDKRGQVSLQSPQGRQIFVGVPVDATVVAVPPPTTMTSVIFRVYLVWWRSRR